jgi:hypothetical protein
MAHDWIIPNFVYDDAGHEYQVERILEQAFMQENATFTGELVIADTISNIGKNAFLKAFTDGTRLVIGNNVE